MPHSADHRAGDAGRLLDVVLRAGGDVAEDDVLGEAAAIAHRDHPEELAAAHV
jgi:hypothetical protein